jgi:hypothetical protein
MATSSTLQLCRRLRGGSKLISTTVVPEMRRVDFIEMYVLLLT